jgi:hypothetical protein
MDSNFTGSRSTAAAARLVAACVALLVLGGCASSSRVQVNSTPSGARILLDGADCGQTTPASVELTNSVSRHSLKIEKAGYNPVEREVVLDRDIDVMDADEAATRVCCAPCTLGCTLIGFLHPFSVSTGFRPSNIDALLEVAGQGARLEISPSQYECYVDGKLSTLLDGGYVVTTPGSHELEIKSPGYRSTLRTIRVDERMYQRIKIDLALEGQGLLLTGSPEGAKVYLDDQFQGTLGQEARRVRAEPGAHMLRVEADGRRPWQDVVQVAADRYQELAVELKREGQGIVVVRPDDLTARQVEVQILVDGQLQGSAFDAPVRIEPGDHLIEIRVTGCETKLIQVRVAKDEYIEINPGPRREGGGKKGRQVKIETTGIRVHSPDGMEEVQDQDVEILVDGALVGYGFDVSTSVGGAATDVTVVVRVKGHRPWEQRVRLKAGTVVDLYPRFEKN